MFKKILLIILSCALIFTLCACSNTQSEDSVLVKDSGESFRLNETSITKPAHFTHDGVNVALNDILYEELVTWFSFDLKNDTDKTVNILVTDLSVNGIMHQGIMSEVISAKSDKKAYFEISNEWFCDFSVKTVKEIEFTVRLLDENNIEFASSDALNVVTNTSAKYVQERKNDGTVIYSSNGALIVAQGLEKSKLSDDTELRFYIENNTNAHFSVIANEVYVNDKPFTPAFIISVGANKCASESLLLKKDELTNAKIDKITSVKASFTAIDKNSGTIFKTELLDIPIK